MSKGQTSIGIVTAFSATAMVLFGWNGWNSLKTIALGEQTAAIGQWKDTFTEDFKGYQDDSNKTTTKISDDVNQLKIDVATTKQLMKLVGDRYQIDSNAVEAQVIKEIKRDELISSTTAVNN